MRIPRYFVSTVVLLWAGASCVRGQSSPPRDRELEVAEARLQEQRATAILNRLALYSDELQKLQVQFTDAGDSVSAATVQQELDAARLAIRRLAMIARGQADHSAADELKEGAARNTPALAARRIDAIVSRFNSKPDVRHPANKRP